MNVHPDFTEDRLLERRRQPFHAAMPLLRRHRWFALFVVLPVALATLYFGLIASDQYLSESRFIVKSPNQRGGQVSTLASLVQTTGLSAGQEQTNEILGYIRSRNALDDLQKRVDVRAAFSDKSTDIFSRFPFPGTDGSKFENLYKFYKGKVSANLDGDTGLAILEVKAFDPVSARKLNAGLLDLSESLVNRLNDRASRKAISEAAHRVGVAEQRVRAARVQLGRYRNSQSLIDPKAQSEGIFEVVTQLTGQRAILEAQLSQMVRAAPANPSIPSLRNRIAAMDRQISGQSGRVVGGGAAIATKMGPYENLLLEQEFAAENLTAASAALEQARGEALKQQFYLERVVEPGLSDYALFPKRLFSIFTVAAAALCVYLIGWMLVVGIMEHSPD